MSFSKDGGESFGAFVRVDDAAGAGTLGRVDVVASRGGAFVSWLAGSKEGNAELMVRHVSAEGHLGPAIAAIATSGARASGFPKMVARGDELIFAWTEFREGRSTIATAAARIPTVQ